MKIAFRQGLINSPPGFLLLNSAGGIDINALNAPVFATVASGVHDYLIEENTFIESAWSGFSGPEVKYLYWDINKVNGRVSRGWTALNLVITDDGSNVSYQLGQMRWAPTERQMYEWNGSRWNTVLRVFAGQIAGNNVTQYSDGSQVQNNTSSSPGKILVDSMSNVFRTQSGGFVTGESDILIPGTGSIVKVEGAYLSGQANENLPKNALVYFVGNGQRVGLASGQPPYHQTKAPVGLVAVAAYQNDPVHIVTAGRVVQDEQWNWGNANIGKVLYCNANGALSLTNISGDQTLRVGTIVSTNSVLLSFDWLTAPSQIEGPTGVSLVTGTVPIRITGASTAAPNVTIDTVSIAQDGALSSVDYTVIMDAVAQVPNKSNIGHTHPIPQVIGLQPALDGKSDVGHGHTIPEVQDLQLTLDGKANLVHTHEITHVNGLVAVLATKANVVHQHQISDTVDLQTELDNRSLVGHTHEIPNVIGLQSALDGKSNVGHGHSIPQVTGLQLALDAKSNVGHGHAIPDVAGLQNALDRKSDVGHQHQIADTVNLQAELNNRSLVGHTHVIPNVIGLQLALDGKSNVGHNHAIGEVTGLQIALDNKSDITHNHMLSSLSDVRTFGIAAGDVLKWNAVDLTWNPGAAGSQVQLPDKEVAFGTGTGITTSDKFTYDAGQRSLHVNLFDEWSSDDNENSEVYIGAGSTQTADSSYIHLSAPGRQYASSPITIRTGNVDDYSMDDSIPRRVGDIILRSGNVSSVYAPSTATAGSVSIASGNGPRGGSISITGGDSYRSDVDGGNVTISAGRGFNGGGKIVLATGDNIVRLELTNEGAGKLKINGDGGQAGYVLTSNGNSAPPSWSPAPSGGGGSSGPQVAIVRLTNVGDYQTSGTAYSSWNYADILFSSIPGFTHTTGGSSAAVLEPETFYTIAISGQFTNSRNFSDSSLKYGLDILPVNAQLLGNSKVREVTAYTNTWMPTSGGTGAQETNRMITFSTTVNLRTLTGTPRFSTAVFLANYSNSNEYLGLEVTLTITKLSGLAVV